MTTGVVSAAPAATLRAAGVERGGTVARHDHRQDAAGVRGAQAGAKVVRVLHAIERQHQRVAGRAELFVELVLAHRLERLDLRDHALVRGLAHPTAQPLRIHALDGPPGAARQRLDLGRACVIAPLLQEDPQHALRCARQQDAQRMQPV